MSSTAVAQYTDPKSFRTFMQRMQSRYEAFVPAGVSVARVVQTAYLAVLDNEKLLKADPGSVLTSVSKIQQWGLEIGTTAYLVPFYDKNKQAYICTPIAAATGLVELVIASGVVRHAEAHCVYANESYEHVRGTSPHLVHHPIADPEARGPLVKAYAIFWLRHNHFTVTEMALAEIEAIRKSSRQWGPDKVAECPYWYAEKTVIRRGVKYLPKGPKLARLLSVVQEEELTDLDGIEDVTDDAVVTNSRPTTATARVVDEDRRPRPLSTAGMVGYDEPEKAQAVPVAPGSVNDHAEADRGEQAPLEYQDDSDLVD